MNRYVCFYDKDKLEEIDFKSPSKKALQYAVGAIVIGIVGYLLGPLANLNVYSLSNLFFAVLLGLIVFGICFKSYLRLRKLHDAKVLVQSNIQEIEQQLFTLDKVKKNETLIGITKDHQLLIIGRNSEKNYFAYLATNKYLHYSPALLNENQENDFDNTLQGKKVFFKVRESL
jgi:hypothetical protein